MVSFPNGISLLTLAKWINHARRIHCPENFHIKLQGKGPQDVGTDRSQPIFLNASLIWKRTCKRASGTFLECGGTQND